MSTLIKPWKQVISHCIKHISCLLFFVGLGYGMHTPSVSADAGLIPTPTLNDVQTEAVVRFDPATNWYTYSYRVTNPGANTGEIWNISIDMIQSSTRKLDSTGLTIPIGSKQYSFDQQLADLQPLDLPFGSTVIPFGQRTPNGWNGGFGRDGFASFSSSEPSVRILPGQTRTGFELISPELPVIRAMIIDPKWVFVVENHEEVTLEEEIAAGQVERQIKFHTFTLGPSTIFPGTYEHWGHLRDDLNQAVQLGWIPDTGLANSLVNQLASARAALDAEDGTLAKSHLEGTQGSEACATTLA